MIQKQNLAISVRSLHDSWKSDDIYETAHYFEMAKMKDCRSVLAI